MPGDAETLRPLAPAIVWSCRRSEGIVEELVAAGVGDRVHDLAGTRLDRHADRVLGRLVELAGAEQVRAVLESLCFRVRDIVEALRAGGLDPPALGVDGGMTANPWLMQSQADVLGIPVRIAATAEATALGAAAAAGVGAGCWTLPDLASLQEGGRTVEPSAGSAQVRDDEYAAWRAFVAR